MTGAPKVQSSIKESGSYALQTPRTTSTNYLTKTLPAADSVGISFCFRRDGGGFQPLVQFADNNVKVMDDGSGRLYASVSGRWTRLGSFTAASRTWACVKAELNSGTDKLALYVKGVKHAEIPAPAKPEGRVQLGDTNTGASGPFYFDSVAIDAGQPAVVQPPATSAPVPSATGAPAAPTGLRVTGSGDGYVDLAWNPNTESDLNGRCPTVAAHPHEYMLYADGTTWLGGRCGTSTRVTGLVNGRAYRFSLAIYDGESPAANKSARSAEVTGTPTGPAPAPNPTPEPTPEPLPTPDATRAPATVFNSDFNAGNFDAWTVEEVAPDRVQIVSSPVREGSRAARFEVRPGDVVSGGNRAELRTWSQKRFHEGDDLWFGWSTRFDTNFPSEDKWALVMQLKNDGTGSPPLEMAVQAGQITLKQSTKTSSGYSWHKSPSVPIARGAWHDFVVHVKFSSNSSVGYYEYWHNGTLVQSKRNAQTMRPGLFSYLKVGYYRSGSHTSPGVVWHDGVRVGRSFAEVSPQG